MPEQASSLAFDLSSLQVFLAVGDAGSMTRAAQAMGMSQPAVSQSIARLEERLGAVLIDRQARPMVLTAAGEELTSRGRRLLDDAATVQTSVRDVAGSALPSLRIGLIDSFAGTAGPGLIRILRGDARHVSVWSGISPSLTDDLLRRRLDIIIITDPLDNRAGLEHRPLMREPFILVIPRRMAHGGPPRRLEDLARHVPFVRYSQRSRIGAQIEAYLDGLGLDVPRSLEFDGTDSVFAMVDGGLGWAITTPLCLIHGVGRGDGIANFPLPGPALTRGLFVLCREGEMSGLAERVQREARTVLSDLVTQRLHELASWAEKDIEFA